MIIGLLGTYHQHVISTFNTYSRGPIHRSLTDTGGGGNPGGADFPHLNPQPSQPTDLHIPPKSPARYQVINPIPIELEMEQTINLVSGSLHSTSTISYHLNIA
jgi:hypothetical protein